jgi:hypothetical protein
MLQYIRKKLVKVKYVTSVSLISTIFILVICSSCIFMKMAPASDVDKGPPAPTMPCNPGEPIIDNSCWLATASNMLAGAGYGTGTTVQARADEIYGEMVAHYGKRCGGWTDAALSWWLSSGNNTWTDNPYTVVTVYGNKSPKNPWSNSNGSQFIGNELRRCQFVGLSISWPVAGSTIGSGGHAITAWGDISLTKENPIPINPPVVRLTDSDNETGGNVQNYRYDDYTNPNPGGPNEGNGWYINYDNNHPYIKHIVTLCPTDDPSDNKATQKVIGSIRIHQNDKINATDLHYKVGTDVRILTYKSEIDWSTSVDPSITESNPRKQITVDWDLSKNPVPYCNWVTITTEFVLPYWNAMSYEDVKFTYPDGKETVKLPYLKWEMKSPIIEKADMIPNVTGGYIIGSFEIIDPKLSEEQKVVAEYRFIHQYSFNQDPELHNFILSGNRQYSITNVKFGHSYGILLPKELWKFSEWKTDLSKETYQLSERPLEIPLNWKGRLQYPEGEDIKGRIPKKNPTQNRK